MPEGTQNPAHTSIVHAAPYFATLVGQVKMNKKHKAVLAIDLGTTFSGEAIVARDTPGRVSCGAPGARNTRNETKVPTVLLRRPDGSWAFGHRALEEYRDQLEICRQEIAEILADEWATDRLAKKGFALFRHYKMQLKDKTSGVESLTAKSTDGQTHSLLELMVKTLEFLSEFALKEIQQGWLSALNVSNSDVLWVLTVPAIWNDFGKAFMRKAAYRAGMIPAEDSDQLVLALEPEAAAIAVHGDGRSYGLIEAGSSFLLLDIGGGTADLSHLKVVSDSPLQLDEIARPTGGPWGGIFVDQQFRELLRRLIGTEKFAKLESHHPVDVAEIMDEFRCAKEDFDPDDLKDTTAISLAGLFSDGIAEALSIPSLPELIERYNGRRDTKTRFDLSSRRVKKQLSEFYRITLSREQMMAFFEPTLVKICDCVKGILRKYPKTGILAIVGGYGSSKVLVQRIQNEFESSPFNRKVIVPDGSFRPQAAIVQGAAYFGLYTTIIGKRVTKYTYGVQSSIKWTEGCRYPRTAANWDSRSKQKRVVNTFSRIVPRDTTVMPFQKFEAESNYLPVYEDQTSVNFPIYRSDHYNPEFTTDDGCSYVGSVNIPCKYNDTFQVAFTFGTELVVEITRQDGEVRNTRLTLDKV